MPRPAVTVWSVDQPWAARVMERAAQIHVLTTSIPVQLDWQVIARGIGNGLGPSPSEGPEGQSLVFFASLSLCMRANKKALFWGENAAFQVPFQRKRAVLIDTGTLILDS